MGPSAAIAIRRAAALALACAAVGGCGGGGAGDEPEARSAREPPAATAADQAAPAAPPSPVAPSAYLDGLDAYCATTARAIERLGRTDAERGDPVRPIAVFARRYRAALERLGQLTPPAALRNVHLLTLAEARESADRIDDGVRFGRAGDTAAATRALGDLARLLPDADALPQSVRARVPACAGPGA